MTRTYTYDAASRPVSTEVTMPMYAAANPGIEALPFEGVRGQAAQGDYTGNLPQTNTYYPYGEPHRAPGTHNRLFASKEYFTDHALKEYKFPVRTLSPLVGRWDRIDPCAEAYYNISPCCMCLGNPSTFIDPNGDKVWMSDDAFKFALEALKEAFGEYAYRFSRDKEGFLQFNGNYKGMTEEQKSVANDFQKAIDNKTTTKVEVGSKLNYIDKNGKERSIETGDYNGAASACLNDGNNIIFLTDNLIIINPETDTFECDVLIDVNDYDSLSNFKTTIYETNFMDLLYHELLETLYERKDIVINHNNKIRSMFDFSKRQYDKTHRPPKLSKIRNE